MSVKDKIAEVLNRFPEVVWDRWTGGDDDWACVYGWIPRQDGRFDFVVIDFDDGEPWKFSTSSADHSKSISERLKFGTGEGHRDCKRVEYDFPNVKSVKLNPEAEMPDDFESLALWVVEEFWKHEMGRDSLLKKLLTKIIDSGDNMRIDVQHGLQHDPFLKDLIKRAIRTAVWKHKVEVARIVGLLTGALNGCKLQADEGLRARIESVLKEVDELLRSAGKPKE